MKIVSSGQDGRQDNLLPMFCCMGAHILMFHLHHKKHSVDAPL